MDIISLLLCILQTAEYRLSDGVRDPPPLSPILTFYFRHEHHRHLLSSLNPSSRTVNNSPDADFHWVFTGNFLDVSIFNCQHLFPSNSSECPGVWAGDYHNKEKFSGVWSKTHISWWWLHCGSQWDVTTMALLSSLNNSSNHLTSGPAWLNPL